MSADIVTFSDGQIQLMKRTVCRPKKREATNDELALFVGYCKRTGLDPFAKQIYAIFRWDKQANDEVMTVQTAIDGFRVIAERTGKYLGKTASLWCSEDGEWREVWLDKEPPKAAKVTVRKAVGEHIAEIPAVAHWKEYVDTKSNMWISMPANQLAKCAESLALRQAFPNDLSGLYTTEEMAQADAEPHTAVAVSAPEVLALPAPPETVERLSKVLRALDLSSDRLQMELVAVGVEHAKSPDEPLAGLTAEQAHRLEERLQNIADSQADTVDGEVVA